MQHTAITSLRASLLVVFVSATLPLHGQNCPTVNFLVGAGANVVDSFSMAGLRRLPNGSYTKFQYRRVSPYDKVDTAANFQTQLLTCTGLEGRTFRTPQGWVPLADEPGVSTRGVLFADLAGNGNPIGLATIRDGRGVGPASASLLVAIPKADGNGQSSAYYALPTQPVGVLVADFNHDGKKDAVVVAFGFGSDPGGVAVLMGKGDGTLQDAVRYPAHSGASGAVAADFNGDGNLDLAVANATTSDGSILLGKGDGTFSAAVNFAAGTQPARVVAGDFNGDGKMDLVFAGSAQFTLLLGNGDGTFRAPATFSEPFYFSGMAVGDFNKDGKLDLALSAFGGDVCIRLGDGNGKFPIKFDYAAGYDNDAILAMDMDGDGNLDLVSAAGHPDVLTPNAYSDQIQVLFGNGDGSLTGAPLYPSGAGNSSGTSTTGLATADFDGDGKPDLAFVSSDLWILLSQGGATFKAPVRIPLASGNVTTRSQSVAAADINGDGKPDLVVGDLTGKGILVLLGNGNGAFQSPVRYPVSNVTTSLALADFNGDGKLDIVACGSVTSSSGTPGYAGVLLGNGDGTFQSIKSLSGFGTAPQAVAVGDFNRDGLNDLAIANTGIPSNSSDPGGIVVYLGLGNGSFQPPVNYAAGVNPDRVVAANINGDNQLDLIFSTNGANSTTFVGILLGNSNGTFQPLTKLSTDFGPGAIAVADLDGDGKQDLVIGHCCGASTNLTYMLGAGNGTFAAEVEVPAAVAPTSVLVADVNGDKKLDVIAGVSATNAVHVAVFAAATVKVSPPLTNVNGASFLAGPLAPDSFATAQGAGLSTSTQQSGAPYPATLGGTTVTVKDSAGLERYAGLAYVSATQINYIVPTGTAVGPGTVTVTAANGVISTGPITIAATGTGLFLFGGTNLLAANVLRVKPDFSQSVEDVYQVSGSTLVPKPIDLGPDTDQVYLVLYATGLRGASQANVTVSANGVNMPVLYSGLQPQYPGLDQIDALIPRSLIGKGDVTITVTVNGQPANTGHVTIK